MKVVILSIAILLLQLYGYESCTCMPRHPQTAFCKAEFAIKAIVISAPYQKQAENIGFFKDLGIPIPTFVYHDVVVTKVLKGQVISNEDTFGNFFKISIRTSKGAAQCGVTLKKGTSYLLTGRTYNNVTQISLCDWVQEYTKLSKQMRKGINGAYDCSCKVATCFDGYCNVRSNCDWNLYEDERMNECTVRQRSCNKIKNKCEWAYSRDYNKCKRRVIAQSIIATN